MNTAQITETLTSSAGKQYDWSSYWCRQDFLRSVWNDTFVHFDRLVSTDAAIAYARIDEQAAMRYWNQNV